MKEQWKILEKYPNYSVSNTGRVKNHITGRVLKSNISRVGYHRVGLYPNSRGLSGPDYVVIHRLVAIYFLKNSEKLPQVNHLDGDKGNNRASNLEWCTASRNIKHSYDMGLNVFPRGSRHFASKIEESDVREIRKRCLLGHRQKDIAKDFGINQQNVSLISRGIAWSHVT